jgi:hypothetical protein
MRSYHALHIMSCYRERIFFRKSEETNVLLGCIKFNRKGSVISVGCSNGSCLLVNLETLDVFNSIRTHSNAVCAIVDLAWHTSTADDELSRLESRMNSISAKQWLHGGLFQVKRAGMFAEYSHHDGYSEETLNSLLHPQSSLLFCVDAANMICCYAVGIFPLFTLDMAVITGCQYLRNFSFSIRARTLHSLRDSGLAINGESDKGQYAIGISFSRMLREQFALHERYALVHLLLRSSIDRASELIASWYDK